MIKLYDENSYIHSFSAVVEKCIMKENGYLILLDKTAFFPTAGGQECDGGTLDGQEVLSVFAEGDEVYHLVKEPIETGKTVSGEIDFAERFRKMQHHSAEHIVSGIAFSRFGLNNVGFHLDNDGVTIDYDAEMSEEQFSELEMLSNAAVWQNLKITASYPETLEGINYRSKTDILGRIRIVTIDGVDVCACCAPHVRSTGEIGVIKLTEMTRHRGGVRIKMICAGDAVRDYADKQKSVYGISTMLSAPQKEVYEAVLRLKTELEEVRKDRAETVKRLVKAEAKNIPETNGNFYIFTDIPDKNALRMLANDGKTRIGGMFAVFSGSDEIGYSYIITAESGVSEFVKTLNAELSGRGGGKDNMAEGQISKTKTEIEKVLEKLL